jgi:hypothetical protein
MHIARYEGFARGAGRWSAEIGTKYVVISNIPDVANAFADKLPGLARGQQRGIGQADTLDL